MDAGGKLISGKDEDFPIFTRKSLFRSPLVPEGEGFFGVECVGIGET